MPRKNGKWRHVRVWAIAAACLLASCSSLAPAQPKKEPLPNPENVRNPEQKSLGGYDNTPLLPAVNGKQWRVHDNDRTQPPAVMPQYDGTPVPAPKGAIVIFDGTNLDGFKNKSWKVKNGVMSVGKGQQFSKRSFGDMHLHLEWMIPKGLKGWAQKQGNSGVFMMEKYEIQILNCWINRTYPDGMTGAMYGQYPPTYNACRKPGEWQSYDVHFTAPVFKNDTLVSPARVTVLFNNVKIHDDKAFLGPTHWKTLPKYKAHAKEAPFRLQNHGNPIHFRNVWVVPGS